MQEVFPYSAMLCLGVESDLLEASLSALLACWESVFMF